MKRTYALLAIAILAASTAMITPGCVTANEQREEARRYVQENPEATQQDVEQHVADWTTIQLDTQWASFGQIGGTVAGLAFGAPAAAIVTGLVNGYRGRRKLGDAKATAISTIVRNVFEATETKTEGLMTVNTNHLKSLNISSGIDDTVETTLDNAKLAKAKAKR